MIREAAKQTLEARQSAKEGEAPKSDEQRVFETEAVTFIVCTNLGLGVAGIGIPSALPWYEGKEPKELKVVGCTYMDELKKKLDKYGLAAEFVAPDFGWMSTLLTADS